MLSYMITIAKRFGYLSKSLGFFSGVFAAHFCMEMSENEFFKEFPKNC